jgi:signal transduction histidine kinase
MVMTTTFSARLQQMIMRISTIILFVGISMRLCAQDLRIIEAINIPSDGVLLDSGWHYKAGDNPDWAKSDYDDSAWKDVRPIQDIKKLPMLWKDSIVWFRIYLNVDSTQVSDLAMNVTHAGASEIYLDGRLVHRFGVVSQDPDEILAFDPNEEPVSFPVNQSGVHVLAVRYVLEPNVHYTTMWKRINANLGLKVRIDSIKNTNKYYESSFGAIDIHGWVRFSAFTILAVLYLTFYVSYRRRKSSLFFFFYAFCWAICWGMIRYLDHSHEVRYDFYIAIIVLIFQTAAWFFCLVAIYDLLRQAKGWIFYALCAFGVICLPISVFAYPNGWYFMARGFATLVALDIVRVSVVSTLRRTNGAGIIVLGASSWVIFWAVFQFANMGYIDISSYVDPWHIFVLSHLILPIAVVIYLGYDFALTNRSLHQKLAEVEVLSAEKNRILSTQNEALEGQVSQRTAELTKSLDHLKATQAQLIQSEKMASLGELTAGIAHEIQNPLNFVNNFSDVNSELIDDLKKEMAAGNYEAAQEIANTIKDNEDKIKHHGKRADGIVKNMLLHSRATSGQKEWTDINLLCDEYTRLAFHGYRAKDKTFNAKIETDFDPSIPKLNVVPQDIGRVILNLVNNAFYVVNEKSKRIPSNYAPLIKVKTERLNDKIAIRVSDNGDGIPDSIKEKVFQPFFTTKPPGQGTGLGLSLTYDIVTKAHGGEIEVRTKQGEGTEFIIRLPV